MRFFFFASSSPSSSYHTLRLEKKKKTKLCGRKGYRRRKKRTPYSRSCRNVSNADNNMHHIPVRLRHMALRVSFSLLLRLLLLLPFLFCLSNTNEIYGLRWMLSESRACSNKFFFPFFPRQFFFYPLALISCSHRNEWIMLSAGRRAFSDIYIYISLFIYMLCGTVPSTMNERGILFSRRGVIQHLGSLSLSFFVQFCVTFMVTIPH